MPTQERVKQTNEKKKPSKFFFLIIVKNVVTV